MYDRATTAQIEDAKNAFLQAADAAPVPSTELLSSWQRSHAALGVPSNVRSVPHVSEELLDAQLLELFRAPLQRFAETLDGTGLGLLLADSSGRILERWSLDRGSERHFDSVGTHRGSVLSEEAVGTNGVGTALVTGHLVQVRGAEHFADFYSRAVCTGAPVRHPITGKVLGVVTLSSDITPRIDLLPPLLQTVTDKLQQHILDLEQPASRRALDAFLHYANARTDPVVTIGPNGLVIQNALASKLSREQLEEIQEVCRELGTATGSPRRVRTESLTLEVTEIEPGNHVAVILAPPQTRSTSTGAHREGGVPANLVGRAPEWLAVLHRLAKAREDRAPLILAGEPGVGKLSVALGFPFVASQPVQDRVVLDAAESHVLGPRDWLQKVAEQLTAGLPTCVRGAETLDKGTLAGLRSLLERSGHSAPAITVSSGNVQEAEDLAVRLGGIPVLWVPPLRERLADLPDLWNSFARSVAPGAGLVLRADALAILRAHRWPGNLTELRTTVSQLAKSGKTGVVAAADLPESMRTSGHALTLIEQLEVQAIRQALQETGGNRERAAEILGISRATVYRKMKSYRLTV